MGSSRKQHVDTNVEQLISVNTDQLKYRLNRIYEKLHHDFRSAGQGEPAQQKMFEYLWDLKEMALLEGKASVQLPQTWLDELESRALMSAPMRRGH